MLLHKPGPPALAAGSPSSECLVAHCMIYLCAVAAAGAKVKGRVLVCADGATSQLATKLGYCTEAPRGVCSRAFVAGGTHNAKFDGVCFYPKWSLPGYAALFRYAEGPRVTTNSCTMGCCGTAAARDTRQ